MPLLLFLSLQILMISGNLTAMRNNSTKLFDMRNIDPARYGDPNGPPEDRVNFVLPDVGFSDYGVSLKDNDFVLFFLDASPTFGLIVLVLFLVYFRDPYLFAECIWIESFMSLMKAPAQLMTSLPDPYGHQAACWDPQYRDFGSWVFTRWSVSFCGDCIWSYHTWHWFFPMLYIHRFLRQTRLCKPIYLWIFRIVVTLWTIGLVIVIIFIQFHYSVDVFLALFLGVFVLTHTPFVEWGAHLLYNPPSEEIKKQVQAIKLGQDYEPPPYERMESEKQAGNANDYGSLSARIQGVSPINEPPGSTFNLASPNPSREGDFTFLTTSINAKKQTLSPNQLQTLSSPVSEIAPRTQEMRETGN